MDEMNMMNEMPGADGMDELEAMFGTGLSEMESCFYGGATQMFRFARQSFPSQRMVPYLVASVAHFESASHPSWK